ncbi:MAG: hypothetical protein Tsb0014_34010 [Pleurocapsa sp.]
MLNEMTTNQYKYKWQIARLSIAVILLLLGLFFRVAHLETKIFWVDEVATAVRVSGYTIPEVSNTLAQQDIVDRDYILQYQQVNSDRDLVDVVNALRKSPEHAPLYFLIARFWLELWGDSITAIRSLSVVFSLLVFPCLYWLCWELFQDKTISWLGVMLMSVSPFYAAYAQEARPYSLWTVAILIMTASLVRATKTNNFSSWLLYGLSLVFNFYTSLFSIFIAIAQGFYLLFIPSKSKLDLFKKYLLTLTISFVTFAPWLLTILQNLWLMHDNTSWMRSTLNVANIIAVWIGTILLIFGDLPISPDAEPIKIAILLVITLILLIAVFNLSSRWQQLNKRSQQIIGYTGIFSFCSIMPIFFFGKEHLPSYLYLDPVTAIGAIVALFILILSAYSLYFLITNTHRNIWLLIITLIISIPLPLVLADIINQGQSSATPRYLIPLQLGIQTAAAYTLATQLKNSYQKSVKTQTFWQIIIIGFLTLGVFSCSRNLNQSPMYQKGRNINNPAIAQIINRSATPQKPDDLVNLFPLVIVEADNAMDLLSLAHSLSSQVKFKVINNLQFNVDIFNEFTDIFLLKPSEELKNTLQQNPKINITKIYQPKLFSEDEIALDLWKLKIINY